MKLSRLIDPNWQRVVKKLSAQDMPLTAAFKLKGILKRGDEELAKYDDVRKAALEKYGDKNEDGSVALDDNGNVKFSDAGIQQFSDELTALLNMDVELGSIKVAELGQKISLSAEDLVTLDDLIKD